MDPINIPEPSFTTAEIAEVLGVSTDWVRRLLKTGRLRGKRASATWRISRENLIAYKPRPVGWQRGRPRGPRRRNTDQ